MLVAMMAMVRFMKDDRTLNVMCMLVVVLIRMEVSVVVVIVLFRKTGSMLMLMW